MATSFLAAGIFLAPMIAGREPRGQQLLAYGLLGALVIVVAGSMLGECAGIHGWSGAAVGWFGNQGFEYLDLGRFWQVLLTIGLFFWVAILFRGMRGRLRARAPGQHALAVLLRRAGHPGLLCRRPAGPPGGNFTTTDFWRFWVVHLWVEDFLELFTTIMVAYIFVLLGVVAERVALTRDLPGHHPLLGRRRDRHHAPPVFLGHARRAHGARRVLLGRARSSRSPS